MKAYIMIGISGSGRSTYVSKHSSKEDLITSNEANRKFLINYNVSENLWNQYKFNKDIEHKVKGLMNDHIDLAKKQNRNIWIDNTNLSKDKNKDLKNYLESLGFEVEFINLNGSTNLNTYLRNNKTRKDYVSDGAINDQYIRACINNYIDLNNPKANIALVDIDGTVVSHDNQHSPNQYVIDVLQALLETNRISFIHFLSGRESYSYEITHDWLVRHGFNPKEFRLLMRMSRDRREDAIVKEEIYTNCIKPIYNVKYLFDDHNQVIDMWLDNKLPVFHVGDYRNVF